jgi:hypothetical protein
LLGMVHSVCARARGGFRRGPRLGVQVLVVALLRIWVRIGRILLPGCSGDCSRWFVMVR